MSIDLNSTEGRKKYLSEKLDNLVEGINESYGKMLLEELIGRLETTIKDFNEEMKNLCDALIKKEKERQQLLDMLKSTDSSSLDSNKISNHTSKELKGDTTNLSEKKLDDDAPEWEKKLAKLEKNEMK